MTWHHSPLHTFTQPGRYIITAGTYKKQHYFSSASSLDRLQETVIAELANLEISLEAWSIFSNHYHLIVDAEQPANIPIALKSLHQESATWLNRTEEVEDRRVWYQYWDTHLSYESSYIARLKYVQENPVKHGLVRTATDYPWCSARNFELNAAKSFYETVMRLRIDRVNVLDPWEPRVE